MIRIRFVLLLAFVTSFGLPAAQAADTDNILEQCRVRAAKDLGAAPDGIDLKYEGQRTDGTHAVNGAANVGGQQTTFQCSFNRGGTRIARFVVNRPTAAAAPTKAEEEQASRATERAAQGQFDANGRLPCAQAKSQPMMQCEFGVARAGGGTGTATVVITLPDGRKRFIFFNRFKATSADLSQADGNMKFRASRHGDLYKVDAGNERYEIVEAVITGG